LKEIAQQLHPQMIDKNIKEIKCRRDLFSSRKRVEIVGIKLLSILNK
jgi:hypothetical protein